MRKNRELSTSVSIYQGNPYKNQFGNTSYTFVLPVKTYEKFSGAGIFDENAYYYQVYNYNYVSIHEFSGQNHNMISEEGNPPKVCGTDKQVEKFEGATLENVMCNITKTNVCDQCSEP